MKGIVIILLSFFILSCDIKKEQKQLIGDSFISQDTLLKFGKNKNYIQFNYKNSLLNISKFENNWISSYDFDESCNLYQKTTENFFGERDTYLFDENGSLYLVKKYLKNKKKGNKFYLQDIIAYNNYVVDSKNSSFLDARIIKRENNKILIEIEYISGYKFIRGKIFIGQQIEIEEESKSLKSLEMQSIKKRFWIEEKDIIYQDYYFEFSALITRDIRSKIFGFNTVKTKQSDNNEFTQFFIVRRLLKSPAKS